MHFPKRSGTQYPRCRQQPAVNIGSRQITQFTRPQTVNNVLTEKTVLVDCLLGSAVEAVSQPVLDGLSDGVARLHHEEAVLILADLLTQLGVGFGLGLPLPLRTMRLPVGVYPTVIKGGPPAAHAAARARALRSAGAPRRARRQPVGRRESWIGPRRPQSARLR